MKLLLILSLFSISSVYANCDLSQSKVLKKIDQKREASLTRYLKRNSEYATPKCLSQALVYATNKSNIKMIQFLLNEDIDLDYIDKDSNESLITTAINKNNYSLINLLLEKGANPNLKINNKYLLDIAIEKNNFSAKRLLEKHDAKMTLDCSLNNSMMPLCYHKRDKPILKISLVYYGNHMKMNDLDRIIPILKERFLRANDNNVGLEIISKRVLPYKHKLPSGYQYNEITDKERLQRIWYYDNVGSKIMNEVYLEYKKVEDKNILEELDAIVAITGAQFDGLGFASGRVSVTEYPREIAWGLPGGGRVEYPSDYQIVDELIHELGHNMFLGHTSTQCQKPGLTLEERNACCAASPSKDDVLSYCRNRAAVDENFMHKFESCNVDMIRDLVVPAMLKGQRWKISPRSKCE